jgi:WD40-like Beta Propeller Repeat
MRRFATILGATALIGHAAAQNLREEARFGFGPPTNLGPTVNSPAFDGGPSISSDGLSLFFTSERPGGAGGGDIWITKRVKMTDPLSAPQNLGRNVNSPSNEFAPSISADGLSIFFDSDRRRKPARSSSSFASGLPPLPWD